MKTKGSKNNINPNSPKYNEKIRNKAIEKTPTGSYSLTAGLVDNTIISPS